MFRMSRVLTALFVLAILATGSSALLASTLPVGSDSLALWYDASAITGQGDYTPLATWSDLSGNGYDLTQSTEANQPLYRTDPDQCMNGKPVVRFDGNNDWMKTGTFATALAQANHAFVVLSNEASGERTVFDEFGPNASNRQLLYYNGAESGVYAGTWLNASFGSSETPTVQEVLFNGVNSYWAIDGTTVASGDAGSLPLASLVLGAGGRNGSNPNGKFFNGRIAEIIFFDRALDSTERNLIGYYLADKYGIETSYVPEPGTITLLTAGLIGLLAYAWRKRK